MLNGLVLDELELTNEELYQIFKGKYSPERLNNILEIKDPQTIQDKAEAVWANAVETVTDLHSCKYYEVTSISLGKTTKIAGHFEVDFKSEKAHHVVQLNGQRSEAYIFGNIEYLYKNKWTKTEAKLDYWSRDAKLEELLGSKENAKVNFIGTDSINGEDCWVLKIIPKDTQEDVEKMVRVWISKKTNLPLKNVVEAKIKVRTGILDSSKITSIYDFNVPINIKLPEYLHPQVASVETNHTLNNKGFFVVGEVENVGNMNIGFMRVHASFRDEEGNLIDKGYFKTSDIISPKMKYPFEIKIGSSPFKITSCDIDVDFMTTREKPYNNVEILKKNMKTTDQHYQVEVVVKNKGDLDLDMVKGVGTFYDAKGNVTAIASTTINNLISDKITLLHLRVPKDKLTTEVDKYLIQLFIPKNTKDKKKINCS